ncbi:MAG: hypothetical protein NVV60_03920 [Luteimonas sp.]|nr:hypothetical protein [Luteimonas sp.]
MQARPASGWILGSFLIFSISAATLPTGKALAVPPAASGVQQATSGDEALDNAVAAVLVSTLGQQFGGDEPVSLRIDSISVQASGTRDRAVDGEGRMRLGDDPDWIGFRYRMLYDTTFGSAGYPEVMLGGVDSGERELPNDASLLRELDVRVSAELDRTHPAGARLQLDRIRTVEAGRRFLRIDASGVADFGLQGSTPIRIESLYDTRKSDWQRVQYFLGSAAGQP